MSETVVPVGGAEIGADAAENLMYHGDQAGEGPEMAGAEALRHEHDGERFACAINPISDEEPGQ
jgi:hypothetical protein